MILYWHPVFGHYAVSSNDEIEISYGTSLELDPNPFFSVVNSIDAVIKKSFDLAFDFAEDGRCEFSTWKADIAAFSRPRKYSELTG